MTDKPKRYHKPQDKGCAWCKHGYVTPMYVQCEKYPNFAVEVTGWCNEFKKQESSPGESNDTP